MPLVDSPSVEEYKNGIPVKQPRFPRSRLISWAVIFILFALLVVLNNIATSTREEIIRTGTVTGVTVNDDGTPISASVFVSGSDFVYQTGEDGRFTISDVPEGDRILVVAYGPIGREYHLPITADTTIDIGTLQVLIMDYPGMEDGN